MDEALLEFLDGAYVPQDGKGAEKVSAVVIDAERANFNGYFGSVLCLEQTLDGLVTPFFQVGESFFEGLQDLRGINLPDIHGQEFIPCVSEQTLGGPVGIDNPAFFVDGMDHIREIIEQDLKDVGFPDFDVVNSHSAHEWLRCCNGWSMDSTGAWIPSNIFLMTNGLRRAK